MYGNDYQAVHEPEPRPEVNEDGGGFESGSDLWQGCMDSVGLASSPFHCWCGFESLVSFIFFLHGALRPQKP